MNPQMAELLERRGRPYKAAVDALPADLRSVFYQIIPGLIRAGADAYLSGQSPFPEVCISYNSPRVSPADRSALATLARESVELGYEIVSAAMGGGGKPLHDVEDALAYVMAHEGFDEAHYRQNNRDEPVLNRRFMSEMADQN